MMGPQMIRVVTGDSLKSAGMPMMAKRRRMRVVMMMMVAALLSLNHWQPPGHDQKPRWVTHVMMMRKI